MSARKVFWLRLAAIVWTLSAASLLASDAVHHSGEPVVTAVAWVIGMCVYYAVAIWRRV